jgi:hypothetical protein
MIVEVDGPDDASFDDVLKLVTEDHVWDAEVDHNSDVARETLEELKYKDDPSNWFLITNEDFEEVT